MKIERIISPQNERLKTWVKLQKDGNERRERGEFILEGRRLVETALASGLVKTFLYADKLAGDDPLIEQAKSRGVEILMLSLVAFRKLAEVPSPQGVACVARVPKHTSDEVLTREALLVVACGVQVPGNLGTMVRSAAAAGATGFIALSPSADLFHPRAVRASAGAILTMPAVRMNTEDFVAAVADLELRTLSAVARGGVDYREADYSRPVAIAVGSEAHGVPESIGSLSTGVTIPMTDKIESLNAAAATALLVFEAVRGK